MYSFTTLFEIPDYIRKNVNNAKYLNYIKDGKYVAISSNEFIIKVDALAAAFCKYGVTKGTTVGIVSASSPFWLMVDFALQRLGAVSVPIFANIASENLTYEIEDAGISYLYIASDEKLAALKPILNNMKLVLVKDIHYKGENIVQWEDFTASTDALDLPSVSPDDLATIIYTSGSTGKPKGVELTHKNLVTQLYDTREFYTLYPEDKILSFLPLAHVFERMVMMFYLVSGVSIYFVDDVKRVGDMVKEVQPTVMTVVPRLLDKIHAKMHDKVESGGFVKKLIGGAALKHAEERDPALKEKSLLDIIFDKMVYGKLREGLGGKLRIVISGGAPLSLNIHRFFLNIGVPVYQGYGLTETSPVISTNTPDHNRCGSCGLLFNHVEARLSAQNELLVRGDSVMRGYHNDPKKTEEIIDADGWLHTGDIAEIDEEGFVTIKSRLKEMFKTSTGKYVSAIPIEQRLGSYKWIDYAMVVAEGRPYTTALLFLDPTLLPSGGGEVARNIIGQIDNAVKEVNTHLNRWEQVKDYRIITKVPTIEEGVLTPSMKLARNKTMEIYKKEIDQMYKRSNQ